MGALTLSSKALARLDIALWVLVGLQMACAVGTFGAGGAQVGNMNKINLPGVPGKLVYSIFIGVLTFILLPVRLALQYFKPAWWVAARNRFSFWPIIISSGILTVLWIGATGAAFYNCSDMCGTIPDYYEEFLEYTSSICCLCDFGTPFSTTCATGGPHGTFNVHFGFDSDVATAYKATQAFSIINMLLFLAATALWVLIFLNKPRGTGDTEMAQSGAQQNDDPSKLPGTYTSPALPIAAAHTDAGAPYSGYQYTGVPDSVAYAPSHDASQQQEFQAPVYNSPQQQQYQPPIYNAPQQQQEFQAPIYNAPQQHQEFQSP